MQIGTEFSISIYTKYNSIIAISPRCYWVIGTSLVIPTLFGHKAAMALLLIVYSVFSKYIIVEV